MQIWDGQRQRFSNPISLFPSSLSFLLFCFGPLFPPAPQPSPFLLSLHSSPPPSPVPVPNTRWLTNVVGADLECLLTAHEQAHQACALVLQQLQVPRPALLPLKARVALTPAKHLGAPCNIEGGMWREGYERREENYFFLRASSSALPLLFFPPLFSFLFSFLLLYSFAFAPLLIATI